MAIVTLSASDMLLAAMAGVMRNVENIHAGRKHRHRADEGKIGDFQMHVVGAAAELALCRVLGIDWPGKGQLRGPDAGVDLQVRASERDGRMSLILHADDPPDHLFYAVRRFQCSARFEIFKPWLCADGRRDVYWRDDVREPAWFVPVEPL